MFSSVFVAYPKSGSNMEFTHGMFQMDILFVVFTPNMGVGRFPFTLFGLVIFNPRWVI